MDCSAPGFLSFTIFWNMLKLMSIESVKVKVKSRSRLRLFATPWTVAYQAPQDFPGKNTGVGCHFLLQEVFLTQGLNLGLLHCRPILYHLATREAHTYVCVCVCVCVCIYIYMFIYMYVDIHTHVCVSNWFCFSVEPKLI